MFISTKGKIIRNKQKKLQKINERQAAIKAKNEPIDKKDWTAMEEQVSEVTAEIAEVKALIDLYMESNPSWNKNDEKTAAAAKDEQNKVLSGAFALVARVNTLDKLLAADASFVESSDSERASLHHVAETLSILTATCGLKSFQDPESQAQFVETYTNLASGADSEASHGVTFKSLSEFVAKSYSESEAAKTNQRIANKALNEQRAKEAEAAKIAKAEADRVKAIAAEKERERKQAEAAAK